MRKSYKSCIVGSVVTTAALLIGSSAFALHPVPIPLLDAVGSPVTVSGGNSKAAYSAKKTCGVCHDYNKIERHSFHAQLAGNEHKGWDPFLYGNMNSTAPANKPWVQGPGHVGAW